MSAHYTLLFKVSAHYTLLFKVLAHYTLLFKVPAHSLTTLYKKYCQKQTLFIEAALPRGNPLTTLYLQIPSISPVQQK